MRFLAFWRCLRGQPQPIPVGRSSIFVERYRPSTRSVRLFGVSALVLMNGRLGAPGCCRARTALADSVAAR
jgi:hypothetical protein